MAGKLIYSTSYTDPLEGIWSGTRGLVGFFQIKEEYTDTISGSAQISAEKEYYTLWSEEMTPPELIDYDTARLWRHP